MHGLTDSPYSVRAEAELYAKEGFYALSLRVPGHGTIPGALTVAKWEDWRAAARLGARHVRGRVPAPLPFHVVGYSNGGALAVQYALDALGDPSLPRPDRVVVMSPMIGVTRFTGAAAVIAKMVTAVGSLPYFAQSRWMDVQPEYNPFKYNSFPAFAGQQTVEITRDIQASIEREAASGRIKSLPPILAFVVARGLDRGHLVDRRRALRPAAGQRQRARALRREPLGDGDGLPEGQLRRAPRRPAREARPPLPARARDQRPRRHAGRRRQDPRAGLDRDRRDAARPRPGRRRSSRCPTSRCRSARTTRSSVSRPT